MKHIILAFFLLLVFSCKNPENSETKLKYTIDNKYKYSIEARLWDENYQEYFNDIIEPYGEEVFKFDSEIQGSITIHLASGDPVINLTDEYVSNAKPGEYWIYIINSGEIWAEYQD